MSWGNVLQLHEVCSVIVKDLTFYNKMHPVRIMLLYYMIREAWALNETTMDNTGREFLLVFLNGRRDNNPVELTIATTANNKANISVQTPIWNSSLSLNLSLDVLPGKILNVNISTEIWLTEDTIEDKAVLVTSTEDIVLYASQSHFALSDSTVVYPVHTIGRSYVSLSGQINGYIGCVAADDSTSVTVTSPTGITLRFKGEHFKNIQIYVNKYETFLIRSIDNTGSIIKSDKPIACFSGSSYSSAKCHDKGNSDHLFTQLVPVEYWTSNYFIASNPNYLANAGDFLHIVALYNDTYIGILQNETCEKYEVKSGTFREIFISSGEAAMIRSNKPIQIGQISCSGVRERFKGDPRLFIPLGDNQFLPSYIFATPLSSLQSPFKYELLVVTETNLTSSLILDGANLSHRVQWTDIDSIGFSFCVIDLEIGVHNLHSLSPGKFGGYMLGFYKQSEFGTAIGRKFIHSEIPQEPVLTIPIKTSFSEMSSKCPSEVFVICNDKQLPLLSRFLHFHKVSSMGCLMWCVYYEQCIVVSYIKDQELCVLYIHDNACYTDVEFGGTIYMKKVVYNVLYKN